jgi:malate dehydrogenase (oxaloacetate-decarboxylating)
VAEVCRRIAHDSKLANKYTIKNNTVAIVTDGSAVLGLGNIGPLAALPVMEGKAILHKKFGGLNAFPICLNTQDTEKIIETVKLIAPAFGAIHLEDIAAPKCFEIERRLQNELNIPVLHDDQHCTAVVVLAALINALKVKRSVPIHRPLKQPINGHATSKIVINGAGSAGIAIAKLLLAYGFKNLIVLDSRRTIFHGRKNLSSEKKQLAKITNRQKINGDLLVALKGADVFIGVSKGGLLHPKMIKLMNSRPIIFALANPIPEIMPAAAKKAGAFVVATGRGDFPNQINNVLVFPGVFRGALNHGVRHITQNMLIRAAENLSRLVKNPTTNKILPDVFDKRVMPAVAKAIAI